MVARSRVQRDGEAGAVESTAAATAVVEMYRTYDGMIGWYLVLHSGRRLDIKESDM